MSDPTPQAFSDDAERDYTYRPDDRLPPMTKPISPDRVRELDERAQTFDPTPKI